MQEVSVEADGEGVSRLYSDAKGGWLRLDVIEETVGSGTGMVGIVGGKGRFVPH